MYNVSLLSSRLFMFEHLRIVHHLKTLCRVNGCPTDCWAFSQIAIAIFSFVEKENNKYIHTYSSVQGRASERVGGLLYTSHEHSTHNLLGFSIQLLLQVIMHKNDRHDIWYWFIHSGQLSTSLKTLQGFQVCVELRSKFLFCHRNAFWQRHFEPLHTICIPARIHPCSTLSASRCAQQHKYEWCQSLTKILSSHHDFIINITPNALRSDRIYLIFYFFFCSKCYFHCGRRRRHRRKEWKRKTKKKAPHQN